MAKRATPTGPGEQKRPPPKNDKKSDEEKLIAENRKARHDFHIDETLEAGVRWRIWDEFFAYSVVKEGAALKVIARSRQTTGSAAERRATPQYQNSAAYTELSQSVYPWDLPFDLAREEATVFLTHLGVSRHDLIEALHPIPEPFDPNAQVVVRLAAERLGFTDTERRILVGESLTPPHVPTDF